MVGRSKATASSTVRPTTVVAAVIAVVVASVVTSSGAVGGTEARSGLTDPSRSVTPSPDYLNVCAPVGADSSSTCLRLTLGAIDTARADEGLPPMVLPSDFTSLSVPDQLFVAIDRERVDRGLAPFAGLDTALSAGAQQGADHAQLPRAPGHTFGGVSTEWIGAVDNGLDADFQWMYDDGPNSGVPGCTNGKTSGCWADRAIVLNRFAAPAPTLVMGAGYDPDGDTAASDLGGSSLAATLAVDTARHVRYSYSWRQALAATAAGTLQPLHGLTETESDTGIPDPRHNVSPVPDYTRICAAVGVDDSPACINAVLGAINHAHTVEGVRAMVLPVGFAQLTVPEQLFVAVNLERVDRNLPPLAGLTTALDDNAQRGADEANDPPEPGRGYALDDAEWAGGSSNGLDAVYGWMYEDGYESGNLDCVHRDASGCWGHRKGLLDDFGTGLNVVMGAAIDTSADTHLGDRGGTSMAVTLAVSATPVHSFVFTWVQVAAALPRSA
jgi:hypothetical protein